MFLSNIKISIRLLALIVVQVVLLGALAAIDLTSINTSRNSLEELNRTVVDQVAINRLSDVVRDGLVSPIAELDQGSSTWEQTKANLIAGRKAFRDSWQQYVAELNEDEAEYIQDLHGTTLTGVEDTFAQLLEVIEGRNRGLLRLTITNDLNDAIQPYFDILKARSIEEQVRANEKLVSSEQKSNQYLLTVLIASAVGILLSSLLGVLVYRSIAQPVMQMSSVVQRVGDGDFDARVQLQSQDELGELGRAFDKLLDDKVADLAEAQAENEALNNSIIGLLQAVFQLSQRDLTVRVPVTEDVTGPVADALNLLTDETAKVLQNVTKISFDVASVSTTVKTQSDKVIEVAEVGRQEVEQTANELTDAARSMNQIAELARVCNVSADKAIETTRVALETVTNTVSGINSTRDTIRETEKRIKRLGERSQEINGIVNIINTIAERTHILALNASMHAASAGEAGRGFAVVANEVQRLAENAREATSQIGTLVSNIQTETAETVNTMNAAITQVVEGSRLAEQAGVQMQDTQTTTAELVAAVQQIATNSQQQAEVSNSLLSRAAQIQKVTQQTSSALTQQGEQTASLVKYARGLVQSVQVFTLPQDDNAPSQLPEYAGDASEADSGIKAA